MSAYFEWSMHVLPIMLESMKWTLALTVVAVVFGTIIGVFAAFARMSRNTVINRIAGLYLSVFRGTPLLLQVLFFYAGLPQLGLKLDAFSSVSVAFILNAGAYIAEIIRAGIQSIDRGQMEAARSLGMSYGMAMRRIILPQTFRRLLPPMVNEVAAITKDTSLAMVAGLRELMRTSQSLQAASFRVWETYFWTGVLYLVITVTLSTISDRLEKKLEARG